MNVTANTVTNRRARSGMSLLPGIAAAGSRIVQRIGVKLASAAPSRLFDSGRAFANGHCLEPVIFDGDVFLIEPRIPKLNEIATFRVRGYGEMVKVMRTDLSRFVRPRIIYFAALNPTFREFGIAAADIERMGTVVEIVRSRAPRGVSRQRWPGLAFEGASR